MSNGTTCCASEVCCGGAEARKKVIASLMASTGAEERYCEGFLNWMTNEGLIFAPESLRPFVQEIAEMAKRHAAH